ncbi:MAG TPA: hypothetical protein VEJ84_14975 [Acidimicrobiales bacterium]|nr:hypothetical protein [Acidimicrobiales bacterium]
MRYEQSVAFSGPHEHRIAAKYKNRTENGGQTGVVSVVGDVSDVSDVNDVNDVSGPFFAGFPGRLFVGHRPTDPSAAGGT